MELWPRTRKCTYCLGSSKCYNKNFGFGELRDASDLNAPHEANLLMLNINKVKRRLGWHPRLNAMQSIALTSDWYKRYKTVNVYDLCTEEIQKFLKVSTL